jgi:hypothetical protein
MTLLPPPRPTVQPAFYCYSIVDVSTEPHTDIDVRMTRAEARQVIAFREDAANLRIRRCRATRYKS